MYVPSDDNTQITSAHAIISFQKPDLNAYLWHCWAGHPSQETIKHITSGKARVKGITWNGKAPHEYCPSCIIGKRQQAPFDHNANHTTTPLELLHMDTCGPMPVKTPQKQEYFFTILDDCTSYNNADLMAKKNKATCSFKDTQAKWENQTDRKVKKVRCDSAKELMKGELGKHFKESGIEVQETAPYAHQHNRKAERFYLYHQGQCSNLTRRFWPSYDVLGRRCSYRCLHEEKNTHFNPSRW